MSFHQITRQMATRGVLQLHEEIARSQLAMEDGVIGQGTVGTVSIATWNGVKVPTNLSKYR